MRRSIFLAVLGMTATAHADRWMTAELPTAVAVSSVQEQVFRPGAMPALGAYISHGRFAVGARLRAGILRDGATPAGNVMDPGIGGLATGGLAARITLGDGFFELVGGGGITGHDTVPVFELGAGWMFDVGSFAVGPSMRYMRVVAATSDAFGSADLVLVGADFRFGKDRPRVPVLPPTPEPPPPPTPPTPEPPPVFQPDGDVVVDAMPSCADLIEFLDEDSHCGPAGVIEVQGDRIILDDRVLFETDHAHVKSKGREIVRAIAQAAKQHPEWLHITVEGHADVRGADDYNQELSQRRAEMTRNVLVKAGIAEDRVSAIGYGRTRPRDPGTTPEAHQHNRRVEFVIDRAPHQESAP